jgi:hypothetical protein
MRAWLADPVAAGGPVANLRAGTTDELTENPAGDDLSGWFYLPLPSTGSRRVVFQAALSGSSGDHAGCGRTPLFTTVARLSRSQALRVSG